LGGSGGFDGSEGRENFLGVAGGSMVTERSYDSKRERKREKGV